MQQESAKLTRQDHQETRSRLLRRGMHSILRGVITFGIAVFVLLITQPAPIFAKQDEFTAPQVDARLVVLFAALPAIVVTGIMMRWAPSKI